MSSITRREPLGNVWVTAVLIGSLAVLLAGGLTWLGLIARVDALISAGLREALQTTGFPKSLPAWSVWLGTAVVAYGLALAMLTVPGTWRRVVLWVSLLLLVAGWAPVLALASHTANIAAPFIAAVWAGACALVYASSRQLPCEQPPV